MANLVGISDNLFWLVDHASHGDATYILGVMTQHNAQEFLYLGDVALVIYTN